MINVALFVVFIFMSFVIMKSDINKVGCILFVHLSSISLENFKDLGLIIPGILELIKLHTYKFGLVSLNFSQIGPLTVELAAGEHLKRPKRFMMTLR